jgi:hypothetical protein
MALAPAAAHLVAGAAAVGAVAVVVILEVLPVPTEYETGLKT